MTSTVKTNELSQILAPIALDFKALDEVIRLRLASKVALIDQISTYIIQAGGKRVRPALLLLVSKALANGKETPHALELAADPHSTLREVERVLLPEGRVVICGFNPASLWGLRQRRSHLYQRFGWGTPFLPATELLGYWRLRDWLRLLGFEVEVVRFGAYRPAFMSEKWLHRLRWLDALGARWWPILGAAYFLVAVKRVPSMTLLSPAWKAAKQRANARVLVANHSTLTGTGDLNHQKTRSTD